MIRMEELLSPSFDNFQFSTRKYAPFSLTAQLAILNWRTSLTNRILYFVHRYVPNNGWSESHFERRRKWDESVLSFMKRKRDAGVKVLWVGDLVSESIMCNQSDHKCLVDGGNFLNIDAFHELPGIT